MINKEVNFIFNKKNYQLMMLGVLFIASGFILMIGYGANTNMNGTFDPNYWNSDIFSFNRIRLAPFLILLGYCIEVVAIFYKENKKDCKNIN